jgi:hypothetical protein
MMVVDWRSRVETHQPPVGVLRDGYPTEGVRGRLHNVERLSSKHQSKFLYGNVVKTTKLSRQLLSIALIVGISQF